MNGRGNVLEGGAQHCVRVAKEQLGVATVRLVLVFSTTHNALAAEAALSKRGIELEVLPTPREISVSCGISIQTEKSELPEILALVGNGAINVKGIYEPEKSCGDGKKHYRRVWGEMQ